MELPSPWSGRRGARRFPRLAHEHGELRAALRKLTLATGLSACPPPGHAFLGMVQALAGFFPQELADHTAQEEAELYPQLVQAVGSAEVAALVAEHRELALLARCFQERAARAEAGWTELREAAGCLAGALHGHLTHEERVIDRAMQG